MSRVIRFVLSCFPVVGPLRAAYNRVELKYHCLTPSELAAALAGSNTALKARAQAQQKWQEAGRLPESFSNPVQVLGIGGDFVLVGIGHEVVVDYALRLKRELRAIPAVWMAGYTNDVAGYLGIRRVLIEGGCEGGGANVLAVGHSAPYAPSVENDVMAEVHRLVTRRQR